MYLSRGIDGAAVREENVMFSFEVFSTLATAVFWGIALAVLVLIEAMTVNLVTIWFAVGALAALISTRFTNNLLTQIVIFLVVSAVALIISKPFMDKARKMKPTSSVGLERNVGRTATVITTITPDEPGRVRLDGVDWAAASTDVLNPGELCAVVAVGSTTLTVAAATEKTSVGV